MRSLRPLVGSVSIAIPPEKWSCLATYKPLPRKPTVGTSGGVGNRWDHGCRDRHVDRVEGTARPQPVTLATRFGTVGNDPLSLFQPCKGLQT